MAKKLVYNYTFTPGAAYTGTIVISGNWKERSILLITNVTDNIIIYNFASPGTGATTSYNTALDETTITLDYDTSSMSASDELQIFVDEQAEKIDFSETFTDPVSKLRVSNPQNLIDTDFEYGLQPTKWETIELVNNVPSFFADASNYTIADVVSVTTLAGSENITVTTLQEHGLTVGSPIDVQGLTSRTAEGKYLVTSVISATQFVYKAKSSQSSSSTISGSYTVITPGEFYSGSDINIKEEVGVETDGAIPSSLNIETNYHHGFSRGSSIYLTNTVGSKKLTISKASTDIAPDGRPYVDFENTLTLTGNVNSTLTETKQMTGTYSRKFSSTAVNTSSNTITWQGHNLEPGDALLYTKPQGDTAIGGLDNFQIYYVKSTPSPDTITLCETTDGNFTSNTEINFSTVGTSDYGRHELILCYEIRRGYLLPNSYYTYWYTRYNQDGIGSGRDMNNFAFSTDSNGNSGYFGLPGKKPDRYLIARKSATAFHTYHIYSGTSGGTYFGAGKNSNFVFGSTADGYNFIEDFERFNDTSTYPSRSTGLNWTNHTYNTWGIRTYLLSPYYSQSRNETFNRGEVFFIPLVEDPEKDSLYIPNHGFADESDATITTTSGSDITYRTDTSKLYNVTPTNSTLASGSSSRITVISENRIRLNNAERLRTATGSYTVVGTQNNPTANTFYFNTHDLISEEPLTLSTTGSLPSSTTGAVDPEEESLTNSTLNTVYSFVDSALSGFKSTMSSDSGRILMNGTAHYYPFRSNTATFDSGSQRFYHYITQMRLDYYPTSTSGSGTYSTNFTTQNFATGKSWDPFSSTSFAGKGYYNICTPYVSNSYVPYWINAWQVPVPADEGATTTQLYFSSRGSYNYLLTGTYGNENNNYSNWSTISGGWQYTYETSYFQPSSIYHGMICMYIVLSNTNWTGHQAKWTTSNNSTNQTITYNGNRSFFANTTGYGGQRYHIEVLIPVIAGTTPSRYGTSGSVKTNAQLAQDIVTSIANGLTNPDLSAAGGSVFAKTVNSNRFSLQNSSKVTYDISSSGTSPFVFETAEKTGGLDGFFSIDAATETSITHFSKTEIPKRTLSIVPSDIVDIDGIIYINKDDFKMKTSQRFVYTESGGQIPITTGGGLVDGTTYYTISKGPNHFQIAASASDANSNVPISIGTTSTGTFTFTVPSIAGISSAAGTVGLSSQRTTVTGTNTLFKRFFRTGDTFKISNEENPPTYQDYEIASVIDDTELTLTQTPGIDIASGKYYVDTKVNTRPDGTFIHRPFDGGVEITAGTSPNSSIVRQTRKYFRYQSGKGIQCSVAINFNPTRLINNIVGTSNTSLSAKTYNINVNNLGTASYNISGTDRDGRLLGSNESVSIMKGDTVNFIVNASGHPFWINTTNTTGTGSSVTTGVTNNGSESGTVSWDTTNITAGTYYYNCQNHVTMNGVITVEPVGITTTIAKATTRYPHGLTRRNNITIKGASDSTYNGSYQVQASDDFSFEYYIGSPSTSVPDGILEYNIDSWSNSAVRCGLFDYQNGMFFEYDGSTLYAVRRSSVQQLSGTVAVQKNSNIVTGTDTNLSGQLIVGDFIVIRGMSYRVTNLPNRTTMHIQPAYRGTSSTGVILTKTIDTKVPQSQWNIDKADGTGPSGFSLDKTKIQMAYIDYSWYGAGKIRFGFKDAKGHVKYMHEFLHNNKLEEAYMRSGNIPGRYEIENTSDSIPSYIPSLFHWGTSVIMDGRFDDDKAYLFTAPSNTLSFTNGDSNTATATGNSVLLATSYSWQTREYQWHVRIPFSSADASKFSSGTKLYTNDESLNGELVDYITYSGNTVYVYIFAGTSRSTNSPPAQTASVNNAEVVYIGAPSSGGDDVDLQSEIPLISIRLAPSVDNNLTGSLGQREIINRMQLQLKQLGITLSHDCNVDLILNGAISNRSFEDVTSPSLSELVKHVAGDKVIGGTKIFSLRASGGTENAAGKRLSNTNDFDISQITDLGNSINGGDGTFPNGPDLLTIAIHPVDTSEINADSPLVVSSRITWTESQA